MNENQLVNPIINFNPADTLHECVNCLEYLIGSLNTIVIEETSNREVQGLQVFLDCVRHAVEFEAYRKEFGMELFTKKCNLSKLESALFERLCKHIEDEDDSELEMDVIPPTSKH